MSSTIATVVQTRPASMSPTELVVKEAGSPPCQSVSMKQSAINAVQQLLVENVAPMPTVTSTESPSGAGNVETKSEKKPRAPKKIKPTVNVIEGAVEVVESAVAVADSAKPEKKPRAPKKVKPTVDVIEGAVVESAVAVVDSAKPEKKPRAPKKVKPTVDSKIDNDKSVILQFIEKMSETLVIDKATYNKLHQSLFPDKSTTTDESSDQQLPDANVVVKNIVSSGKEAVSPPFLTSPVALTPSKLVVEGILPSDQPHVDEELEEGEEFEEELVTTEFVHKGVLYLKDTDDNLYSRNPPHEFVLNLLE